MNVKLLLVVTLIQSLVIAPVFADDLTSSYSLSKELIGRSHGSEFISGESNGGVMMRVNLWGAVNKPGIHYVPPHTDLITLLSYAGGPIESARMDQITIKRRGPEHEEVIPVDGEKLLQTTGGTLPMLQANDIIVVPTRKPLLSNDTVTVITVVGTILSIALAGFALSRANHQ